ncbi:MAG: deoxyhypusine synthase [Nitrospinota bacterium]
MKDEKIIYLKGNRICPDPIDGSLTIKNLVNEYFNGYNAARLKEICQLVSLKMSQPDVFIGVSLSGALTPAGLGSSCIVPLMRMGMIDYIISTGANLYHDLHHSLNLELLQGSPFVNDNELFENNIIRIYDIFMDFNVLTNTDHWLITTMAQPEFQKRMGTRELHQLIGKYADQVESKLNTTGKSIIAEAYRLGVPIYTSSPGDSTLGMDIAALNLIGKEIFIDPSIDVNETSAIVLEAKLKGKSGVIVFGGGSPKNFILQTEPTLQEVLGIDIKGHDYFAQITDARPDTGGLSGATPYEAVSWAKIDPETVHHSVVCYCDTTIVMPILVGYLQDLGIRKTPRKLCEKIPVLIENLRKAFLAENNSGDGNRNVSEVVKFLKETWKETKVFSRPK